MQLLERSPDQLTSDVSMPLNNISICGSGTHSGSDASPGSAERPEPPSATDPLSCPSTSTPCGQKRSLADEHGDAPYKVIVRGVHEGQAKRDVRLSAQRRAIESLEQANHQLKAALLASEQRLQLAQFSLAQSQTRSEKLEAALTQSAIRLAAVQQNAISSSTVQEGATITEQEGLSQVERLAQVNVSLEKTCDRLKQRLRSAMAVVGCFEDTNTTLLAANTSLLQFVRQLDQEEL
ncbi:hypothetical protein C8R46DRAFT_1023661 [Mycena filopes]|nr:hypothetical protein C8R46DRAFT_1023661 [Mycena filopes]